jgi:1,4-alpha-glucan branching enzyme
MVGHPGKKLLFMGQEFGQRGEWTHDHPLDWHSARGGLHAGVQRWTQDVFSLYREHPALHDDTPAGFEWIDFGDRDNSVVSYLRKGEDGRSLLFVINATPVVRDNYRVGVPRDGVWTERLNSDAETYGGSGVGNRGEVETTPVPYHGRPASLVLTLPPLAALVLELKNEPEATGATTRVTSARKVTRKTPKGAKASASRKA